MQRILLLLLVITMISCKENNKQNTAATSAPNKIEQNNIDTVPFYPYITAMEKEAETLSKNKNEFTVVYTNESDNTSTKKISSKEFQNLIKKITQYNITQMPVKHFYKEELFTDLTTKNTIINYATQNDSLSVKNVSILLDAKNTNNIKRIDIKTMYATADSTISENCSWVVGKEFYILRYAEDTTGKSAKTKLNVSWKK